MSTDQEVAMLRKQIKELQDYLYSSNINFAGLTYHPIIIKIRDIVEEIRMPANVYRS